jgi:hypothetical protein
MYTGEMSSQSINMYSHIFNPNYQKDYEFYKTLFTTPVHTHALESVLVANCEEASTNESSNRNIEIVQEIFINGVIFLGDAMQIENDSELIGTTVRNNDSGASIKHATPIRELDDGGDDLTSLNGNIRRSLIFDDDGDDITTLSGKPDNSSIDGASSVTEQPEDEISKLKGKVSTLKSKSLESSTSINSTSSISNKRRTSSVSLNPQNPYSSTSSFSPRQIEFTRIDEELRLELICNILAIFQTWFKSLFKTNQILRKSKRRSLVDIVTKIFKLPGTNQLLNDTHLQSLLQITKQYFDSYIKEIENTPKPDFKNLKIIKEILILLADMIQTLFSSAYYQNEESNEFVIVKSLLYSIYKVDFSCTLDKLLSVTLARAVLNDKHYEPDDEEGTHYSFEPPKIVLSAETLLLVYSIIGTLTSIPTSLLPVTPVSLSSDITNLQNESPNVYEQVLVSLKNYDAKLFKQEVSLRLIPFLAMEFRYCYHFREDMLVSQIQNSSFFNWITGNRFADNLYISYNTNEQITSFSNNFENLSILADPRDPYLADINSIYDIKIKKLNQKDEDDALEVPELLPITLLISALCKNASFLVCFTKQISELHKQRDIEDVVSSEDMEIELFEIWICVLSYVFQNQYKSIQLQLITKISLLTLLAITSPTSVVKLNDKSESLIENIKNYQINEFKWKLCHQKLPTIPVNVGKHGFKSGLLYILDVVQNLLRFNLTNRLSVPNFKMALSVVFQILNEFKYGETKDLGNYTWVELYVTLFNLLKFIKRQNLSNSKYFQSLKQTEDVKSMVEEILVLFDIMLSKKFTDIIQVSDDFVGLGDDDAGAYAASGVTVVAGTHLYKSINYDLIYNILINHEIVGQLLEQFELGNSEHLGNLRHCIQYFEDKFHLNEESKEEKADNLNLFDHDFDSPVLIQELNAYKVPESIDDINLQDKKFKFEETFKYSNQNIDAESIPNLEMIKIFNEVLLVAV